MTKHKAWRRQKELKKKYSSTDIPRLHEIEEIIGRMNVGSINRSFQTRRAQALFSLYYLTACRASEITKLTKLRRRKLEKETFIDSDGMKKTVYSIDSNGLPKVTEWTVEHNFLGTRKCDIRNAKYGGNSYLEVRTENRKNKSRSTKLLPIPISLESGIAKYLLEYLDTIIDEQDILFPFTQRRAAQIINQSTGFNIHFIRHMRATHLITLYDFNEQMLVKYMGWTDSRPAKAYMELSTSTLAKEFYKNKRGDA